MKTRSPMLTAVLLTAVVVSAGWMLLLSLAHRTQQMGVRSNVVAPMSEVIADLNATAQQGRHELVRQKIEALSRHWEAFRRQGDAPSVFWSAVVRLGATNTAAAGPESPAAKPQADRVGP